jgi:chromosomal replication initiation ATPase DnaA
MDSEIVNDDDNLQRDELWSAALERLQSEYSNAIFEMWLKPIRLVELGPSEIVLSVHSKFAQDWVENRFKSELAQVLCGLLGEAVDLRFIVADGIEDACGSPAQRSSNERLDRIEARLDALEAQAAAG